MCVGGETHSRNIKYKSYYTYFDEFVLANVSIQSVSLWHASTRCIFKAFCLNLLHKNTIIPLSICCQFSICSVFFKYQIPDIVGDISQIQKEVVVINGIMSVDLPPPSRHIFHTFDIFYQVTRFHSPSKHYVCALV